MKRVISWLALSGILVAACVAPAPIPAPTTLPPTTAPTAIASTATATPVPTAMPTGEEPLYVSLVWHQHQPLYYKDPQTGIYTRPWVRVHATKDYYDMAATVAKYPNVHVTFNLTPVLIRQLDDFSTGAKDIYWVMAEKPPINSPTTTSALSYSASSTRTPRSLRVSHVTRNWPTNARALIPI